MKFDYQFACFVFFIALAVICFIAAIVAVCETAFTLAAVLALSAALTVAFAAGCGGDA